MVLTDDSIKAKLAPHLEEGNEAEQIIKELKKCREKSGKDSEHPSLTILQHPTTSKEILAVLNDFSEEDQRLFVENLVYLRDKLLPEVSDLMTEKLEGWFRINESEEGSLESRAKGLTEIFKEIHTSVLLKHVKLVKEEHKKVKFLFLLGQAILLSSSENSPKFLKKVPQIQTWCQRLTQGFFEVEGKSNVIDIWCSARKNRSYKMWKTALEEISKSSELKEELRESMISAFNPAHWKKYSESLFNHVYSKSGAIKLAIGESNLLFQSFDTIVKKDNCCKNRPCKGFYENHIETLPKYSIDLGSIMKLVLQVIDKQQQYFTIETAAPSDLNGSIMTDGQQLFLQMKQNGPGFQRLKEITGFANKTNSASSPGGSPPGMSMNQQGSSSTPVPEPILLLLESKGVSREKFLGKPTAVQNAVVEQINKLNLVGGGGGKGPGQGGATGSGDTGKGPIPGSPQQDQQGGGNPGGPGSQNPQQQQQEWNNFNNQIREVVMRLKGQNNVKGIKELKGKLAQKGKDLAQIMQGDGKGPMPPNNANNINQGKGPIIPQNNMDQQGPGSIDSRKGDVIAALKGKGKSEAEIRAVLPQVLQEERIINLLVGIAQQQKSKNNIQDQNQNLNQDQSIQNQNNQSSSSPGVGSSGTGGTSAVASLLASAGSGAVAQANNINQNNVNLNQQSSADVSSFSDFAFPEVVSSGSNLDSNQQKTNNVNLNETSSDQQQNQQQQQLQQQLSFQLDNGLSGITIGGGGDIIPQTQPNQSQSSPDLGNGAGPPGLSLNGGIGLPPQPNIGSSLQSNSSMPNTMPNMPNSIMPNNSMPNQQLTNPVTTTSMPNNNNMPNNMPNTIPNPTTTTTTATTISSPTVPPVPPSVQSGPPPGLTAVQKLQLSNVFALDVNNDSDDPQTPLSSTAFAGTTNGNGHATTGHIGGSTMEDSQNRLNLNNGMMMGNNNNNNMNNLNDNNMDGSNLNGVGGIGGGTIGNNNNQNINNVNLAQKFGFETTNESNSNLRNGAGGSSGDLNNSNVNNNLNGIFGNINGNNNGSSSLNNLASGNLNDNLKTTLSGDLTGPPGTLSNQQQQQQQQFKKRKIIWDNSQFLQAIVATGLNAKDLNWRKEWERICMSNGLTSTSLLNATLPVLQCFVEKHLFDAYSKPWAHDVLYIPIEDTDDGINSLPQHLLRSGVLDPMHPSNQVVKNESTDNNDNQGPGQGQPGGQQLGLNGQQNQNSNPNLSNGQIGSNDHTQQTIINNTSGPGGIPTFPQSLKGQDNMIQGGSNLGNPNSSLNRDDLRGQITLMGRNEPTGNTVSTVANQPIMFLESAGQTGFTDSQPPFPGSQEEKQLIDKRNRFLRKLRERREKRQREMESSDDENGNPNKEKESNTDVNDRKRKRRKRIQLTSMLGFSDQEDHRDNDPNKKDEEDGNSTDEELLFSDGPSSWWKTKLCYAYQENRCDKGKQCPFAHHERDLKQPGEARSLWQKKLRERGVIIPASMVSDYHKGTGGVGGMKGGAPGIPGLPFIKGGHPGLPPHLHFPGQPGVGPPPPLGAPPLPHHPHHHLPPHLAAAGHGHHPHHPFPGPPPPGHPGHHPLGHPPPPGFPHFKGGVGVPPPPPPQHLIPDGKGGFLSIPVGGPPPRKGMPPMPGAPGGPPGVPGAPVPPGVPPGAPTGPGGPSVTETVGGVNNNDPNNAQNQNQGPDSGGIGVNGGDPDGSKKANKVKKEKKESKKEKKGAKKKIEVEDDDL